MVEYMGNIQSIAYLYQKVIFLYLLEDIEIKEFEWYLRDHMFLQSNQVRQEQFKKDSLAQQITSTYLRQEF